MEISPHGDEPVRGEEHGVGVLPHRLHDVLRDVGCAGHGVIGDANLLADEHAELV